jgi:hypothetical protein
MATCDCDHIPIWKTVLGIIGILPMHIAVVVWILSGWLHSLSEARIFEIGNYLAILLLLQGVAFVLAVPDIVRRPNWSPQKRQRVLRSARATYCASVLLYGMAYVLLVLLW